MDQDTDPDLKGSAHASFKAALSVNQASYLRTVSPDYIGSKRTDDFCVKTNKIPPTVCPSYSDDIDKLKDCANMMKDSYSSTTKQETVLNLDKGLGRNTYTHRRSHNPSDVTKSNAYPDIQHDDKRRQMKFDLQNAGWRRKLTTVRPFPDDDIADLMHLMGAMKEDENPSTTENTNVLKEDKELDRCDSRFSHEKQAHIAPSETYKGVNVIKSDDEHQHHDYPILKDSPKRKLSLICLSHDDDYTDLTDLMKNDITTGVLHSNVFDRDEKIITPEPILRSREVDTAHSEVCNDGQGRQFENNTQEKTFEPKLEPKLLVAAIDIGTTYSGYAFTFSHDQVGKDANPVHILTSNWVNEGGGRLYQKTPTCLLLDPGENLHSFGSTAMEKYSSLTDDDEHHDWYFFWQFKMILHQEEEICVDTVMSEENGKELEAIKVFQYSIQYLKDHLVETVRKTLNDIREDDIRWVITVPAIWNDSAKKFMRQAASQAGIKKDLIEIALEPEAASLYCRSINLYRTTQGEPGLMKFPVETRYLVLDCGGGTVDVTVHEVLQGNRLRELHAATGGNWGGANINKAFCRFVSQLAGPERFHIYSSENKAEYLQFLENFEGKKRSANSNSFETVRINVPYTLLNILLANQINFEKIKGRIRVISDKLIIEAEHFRSFFEKPVKDIIKHIEEIVEIVPGKLDTILLVGGFAESSVLQKAVKDNFEQRFKVITPLDASLCVLKGAVLYGLNPVSIAYRRSRYTYGVSTSMRFQRGVHPPERRSGGSKEAFCDGIFDVHVKVNQEVPTNKAVRERTYYPITNDDKLLQITLYRSLKEDPKFVDEEDCKPVGTMEIKIDTSVGKTSRDRPVKVKMIFGGSDIKVLAQQNNRKPPQEADFKLNGMF